MAWVPLALAATAAVVSTAAVLHQGKAAAQSQNYQAQVADNNSKIAEQNAQYATQAGGVRAGDIQQRGRVAQGRIKAAQAASGLDVNSGSAVNVRASQAVMTKVDALRTEHDAALEAYGYRTQGVGYQAQAGLDRMGASNSRDASYFSAGGTLLGGASSLAGKWGSQSGDGNVWDTIYNPETGPGAGASNYGPG